MEPWLYINLDRVAWVRVAPAGGGIGPTECLEVAMGVGEGEDVLRLHGDDARVLKAALSARGTRFIGVCRAETPDFGPPAPGAGAGGAADIRDPRD